MKAIPIIFQIKLHMILYMNISLSLPLCVCVSVLKSLSRKGKQTMLFFSFQDKVKTNVLSSFNHKKTGPRVLSAERIQASFAVKLI